jgi:hypothetical protein
MLEKILLAGLALTLAAQPACAQAAPAAPAAEALASAVYGFDKATVLAVTDKTYQVYVPLNGYGFSRELPLFPNEGAMRQFNAEPQLMAVDRVQSVQTSGAYLEHMVLNGKRQHVLALRTANGPVELFSYTEAKRIHMAARGAGLQKNIGYVPNPTRQHWYLRRQGVLTEVQQASFAQQLATYFQDDPATVASLTSGATPYQALTPLVEAYNQRHPAP